MRQRGHQRHRLADRATARAELRAKQSAAGQAGIRCCGRCRLLEHVRQPGDAAAQQHRARRLRLPCHPRDGLGHWQRGRHR
ncbi:MAG: hypothetical protein EBS99_11450, partial [Betaproteobacteria bacterium]|nr:hypothetical protein [Betaproteobacteria bacterium]